MLVDSHCHLDFNDFEEDFSDILQRMKENSVNAVLNAGNSIDTLDEQLALSTQYPFIFTAVGVHPHNANDHPYITADEIAEKTAHKKVVAIGECGLDYFYNYSDKATQVKVFIEHIKAAQQTQLPLIIHTRDADDDTMKILAEYHKKSPIKGVLHCFSSSQKLADFAISIGFYISASGIITFNKSNELRDIFANIPMENLLVETDSPFLAPVPLRGKRNEPANVKYVAEKLAQIKNISFEKTAEITTNNFYALFRKASDKGRYNV